MSGESNDARPEFTLVVVRLVTVLELELAEDPLSADEVSQVISTTSPARNPDTVTLDGTTHVSEPTRNGTRETMRPFTSRSSSADLTRRKDERSGARFRSTSCADRRTVREAPSEPRWPTATAGTASRTASATSRSTHRKSFQLGAPE